jgi:hypothetical protein
MSHKFIVTAIVRGNENALLNFRLKIWREEATWEIGVEEMKILKCISEK